MHFIRVLTLFACCLMSGTLGVGLIILDMKSLGVIVPELDKTWVGATFLFFLLMFVIELVINVDNKKGQNNEENS